MQALSQVFTLVILFSLVHFFVVSYKAIIAIYKKKMNIRIRKGSFNLETGKGSILSLSEHRNAVVAAFGFVMISAIAKMLIDMM